MKSQSRFPPPSLLPKSRFEIVEFASKVQAAKWPIFFRWQGGVTCPDALPGKYYEQARPPSSFKKFT